MRQTRLFLETRVWQRIESPNPAPCGLTESPGLVASVVAWHDRHVSSPWYDTQVPMFRWAGNACP